MLEAGVRQVLWLISSSCCFVTIDVNDPILHLDMVSQVLREIPSFKGILSILHWWGEHCTKGRILWGCGCQPKPHKPATLLHPQQRTGTAPAPTVRSPHGALCNSFLTPCHPNLKSGGKALQVPKHTWASITCPPDFAFNSTQVL